MQMERRTEQWLADKAKEKMDLSLYEKKIEAQLEAPLHGLCTEIQQVPKWDIKKNSEGKNVSWLGYKGNLAVGGDQFNITPWMSVMT